MNNHLPSSFKPQASSLNWQEKVKTLPAKPGVYLFKDETGRIIYVGKAASLIKRVVSYTRHAADAKTQALIAAIHDFEHVVTSSELEALVLENVLIKKEQPRYNLILRDDKNYPYLHLTIHDPFPRLKVVRRMGKKREGLYFGPYVPAGALRSTLKLLSEIFPLRHCNRMIQRPRPCLYYQMHRCSAPCAGMISQEDYGKYVQQIRSFLEGKTEEVVDNLRFQMEAAAYNLKFEEAARLRDNLAAIGKVSERQKIISVERVDEDIVGMAMNPAGLCFTVLFVRQGMLIGHKDLLMEGRQEEDIHNLLTAFLEQLYAPGGPQIPPHIVLPIIPLDQPLLEAWLGNQRGNPVELSAPRSGKARQLVEMAGENARSALQQQHFTLVQSQALITRAQADLGLPVTLKRIEGFDISNIQGQEAVGSMVVWRFPGFLKSGYRHFKIKTVAGIDDYSMLAEIVRRRYQHLSDEERPDLILIDGGKGQVNATYNVLEGLNLKIPIIGLAKREEEIFFPNTVQALKLPSSSPTLHLLQRIRDEAHRFAIEFHRKRRSKAALKSPLEDIPGLGARRKQKLLNHFGSLERIQQASWSELEALPFLPADIARILFEHWRKG
ncbi:MAG: excinuclease ABC subunit UvrC [Candidatus Schekmanbacteria bacterium]|nr:excinuclease ABC subunit UvrC [Candidatus Schekmanbacteria bacterium]